MTLLLLIAGLLMSSGQETATASPEADARPTTVRHGGVVRSDGLVQTVDAAGTARCMGEMVGFRNVPLRCVVGTDARLTDCEVRTTNRAALRYTRVFRCMASNVRVFEPGGTIPVGRSVAVRIHGSSFLSNYAEPPVH